MKLESISLLQSIYRPFRFAIVGLINTGVDIIVFIIGLTALSLPLWAVNILAWAAAVSVSYFLNGVFTFGHKLSCLMHLNGYLKFVAAGALAGVLTTFLLVTVSQWWPIWLAKLLAIGMSFIINYWLAAYHVFSGNFSDDKISH